ncbi:MAG: DUF1549 domain-containing protein, partial [Planctomycetota bacterium]|nr:DUF1549 domain-containing protein [Planctomycetota bacterium]
MLTRSLISSIFLVLLTVYGTAKSCQADDDADVYATKIKPMFRERCFSCHGALKQESNLRLDSVDLMVRGGDSGSIIVRGDSSMSLLLDRVTATDIALRMPPEHEGEALTSEQIDLLRHWIDQGAHAPEGEQPEPDPRDHWAFRSVTRPEVPAVANIKWVRNPIDAFLAAKHEAHGLVPQSEASREILLRRLSLDLIGLPPTAQEIAAFENDHSPEWYERAVDRLLNDPRYGERWGRHWMDIWRYSDWWGLGDQLRNSHPHIWHWRDWLIESLNADLPYDQMIRLMLAADELHPNDLDKLRAGGYLARNYFLFNRNQWMEETVEHVSKGFLGLTMNCAKCHDHKFDPIAQHDFYKMRAFFEPYHVRIDAVPGETNLAKDGIPRPYDGHLDSPTYRFIRGQEKSPDTSTIIAPGVPAIFDFAELKIEPLTLPSDAWQTARRPWVIDAHLEAAKKKVQSTEKEVATARATLDSVRNQAAESSKSAAKEAADNDNKPSIHTTFESLDEQHWKLFGGEWQLSDGNLEQNNDGPNRAALRWLASPPRNFDATMKFTIRGGSQYRSVCLSFDSNSADPTAEPSTDDFEQLVYVSAQDAGSKVHAAILRGKKWEYPPEALVARPIELNREYTFRVQARDTLINVSLNGDPVLAWRTPVDRRDGAIQLVTFDALVAFHDVSISPLDAAVALLEPGFTVSRDPVTVAEGALRVAELSHAASLAELSSVERRIAAMQANWARSDATANQEEIESLEHDAAKSAALAERTAAVAHAKLAVAEIEIKLEATAPEKKEPVEKELAAAQETLKKAEGQLAEPGEAYTKITGAAWVPTRFFNSTADDPAVEFPSQSTGRRTALANWIADRRNPLTARVAVNHIWMRHLGEPLVPTVFDFGRKGIRPLHPELLDWLASELMDQNWSMKHLHRVIVNSAVYRMSSSTAEAEENVAIDGDNRYWWRRVPIRLESQVVRDSILLLAGTLDETMGGPPVPASEQGASTRRSLYFFHSNNERNLFLTTFDDALVKDCYRRETSIVPQQALALTNSRLVLD